MAGGGTDPMPDANPRPSPKGLVHNMGQKTPAPGAQADHTGQPAVTEGFCLAP
jgi:hypothetical protein